MELSIKQHGITITETRQGLEVCQGERCYTAEHWTLSSQVCGIIIDAVNHGFNKLYCVNNPKTDKAHYICFARDHDRPWDFKLAREGLPRRDNPAIHCITVNKIHQDRLKDKIWFCVKKQNAGDPKKERVKHLEVHPSDFRKLLRAI